MKKHNGLFITFEGIDGSGKSTQARRLYRHLKRLGYPVILVREPGGTKASERIRHIILDPDLEITPLSELLLYEAARSQVTQEIIWPALKAGTIVVCDRYYDSTVAYQGYGRGLDKNLIGRLNSVAALGLIPDITFIFDVDYKTALSRRNNRPDRLEKEKELFFNRVRRGFRQLAGLRRVYLLNGRRPIAELKSEIEKIIMVAVRRRRIKK